MFLYTELVNTLSLSLYRRDILFTAKQMQVMFVCAILDFVFSAFIGASFAAAYFYW